MKEGRSSFLDKETLIALAFIFSAWFLWESRIRSKYQKPTLDKKEISFEKKAKEPVKKREKKETKEHFFNFEDEKWKIKISSKGAGIKYLELKKFFDRKGKKIHFQSIDQVSLFEIRKNSEPLNFNLKKIGGKITGVSEDRKVRISIEIEKDYFLSYHLQNRGSENLEIYSSNLPVKGGTGLLESLIKGVEPPLSFFAKSVKKEEERFFYSEEEDFDLKMTQAEMMGFGTRYFGQAFFNRSDTFPDLFFQGQKDIWQSQIIFETPRSGKEKTSIKYLLFFGPKSMEHLEKADPKMISWIDFGFLSFLARFILSFLKMAFLVTQNWGLSIILLTFLIRVLLFPLNLSAYRSMKIMKKIQPEIQALRKKYKKDMKTMNEQMLALMKKNKANPFGGCVPMLLQLPVFFALYRVLGESFELYQAPFFGWIQDLSLKDPFYVLPILMGGSMYLQQKMTPTNMDPLQEKMLRILPLIFTVFMLNLPSGLNLYILVSTIFGILQQYYFTKTD